MFFRIFIKQIRKVTITKLPFCDLVLRQQAVNLYSSDVKSLILNSKENRFNDVHVYPVDFQILEENETHFDEVLKNSLMNWEQNRKISAWLHIPIELSHFIRVSSKYGFKYHHAEDNEAVLCKWLVKKRVSKIPRYATHQLGVSGLVYRQETDEILLIKDKNTLKDVWKLPGGAADLGEYIEDTAVREVFEETGVKTEFKSIIAFRQQHDYPGAYGRSDLYVVCRLKPHTFDLTPCKHEILECKWEKLDNILQYRGNNLLQRVAKLIAYAKQNNFNFNLIDIEKFKLKSIIVDTHYSFYHRNIPTDDI